LEKKVKLDPR